MKHSEHVMVTEFALNHDFAAFKNHLKAACTGDYIFQIDADEYPDEYLIDMLPHIIEANADVDMFWVPRINIVQGLTTEHARVWGWELSDNRINFPDYQCRILRNTPEIQWKNRVHEVLTGHRRETRLPVNDEYCLHHPKTIERQIAQNKFYDTL
jgi:glycosyltransferase involved in cell wall biosynthesis